MNQSNKSMPIAPSISSLCESFFISNHPNVTRGQFCVTSNTTDTATQIVKSCCPSPDFFVAPVNVSGSGGGSGAECGAGCLHPGEAIVPSSELFCGHDLPTTACFNVTSDSMLANGGDGAVSLSKWAKAAWALAVGVWVVRDFGMRFG